MVVEIRCPPRPGGWKPPQTDCPVGKCLGEKQLRIEFNPELQNVKKTMSDFELGVYISQDPKICVKF